LLKTLGLGKPLVVAGAWALGAAVLPAIEAGQSITLEIIGLAGYRLAFILPNVLLADWGDREGDAAAGLRPWTEAGTGRLLRIGVTALLLTGAGLAVGLSRGAIPAWLLLIDGLGLVWMGGAVWGLEPERPSHRWLMDLVVAWPVVPALVNWGIG
jgi:4-hydroxybenzoate polyprenyltransferase